MYCIGVMKTMACEVNAFSGGCVTTALPRIASTAPAGLHDPLLALNDALDRLDLSVGVNERVITAFMDQLEAAGGDDAPRYWLLTARLTELALLCAGRYADGCEFEAAGDLLVNPRQIMVRVDGRPRAVAKRRHGQISEQFNPDRVPQPLFMHRFRQEAALEIVRPAILPDLQERMERSGRLSPAYLSLTQSRMCHIADAIAYLLAWQISDDVLLWKRLRKMPPDTRELIEAHLCRFDDTLFHTLGRHVRRLSDDGGWQSEFLHPGAEARGAASCPANP